MADAKERKSETDVAFDQSSVFEYFRKIGHPPREIRFFPSIAFVSAIFSTLEDAQNFYSKVKGMDLGRIAINEHEFEVGINGEKNLDKLKELMMAPAAPRQEEKADDKKHDDEKDEKKESLEEEKKKKAAKKEEEEEEKKQIRPLGADIKEQNSSLEIAQEIAARLNSATYPGFEAGRDANGNVVLKFVPERKPETLFFIVMLASLLRQHLLSSHEYRGNAEEVDKIIEYTYDTRFGGIYNGFVLKGDENLLEIISQIFSSHHYFVNSSPDEQKKSRVKLVIDTFKFFSYKIKSVQQAIQEIANQNQVSPEDMHKIDIYFSKRINYFTVLTAIMENMGGFAITPFSQSDSEEKKLMPRGTLTALPAQLKELRQIYLDIRDYDTAMIQAQLEQALKKSSRYVAPSLAPAKAEDKSKRDAESDGRPAPDFGGSHVGYNVAYNIPPLLAPAKAEDEAKLDAESDGRPAPDFGGSCVGYGRRHGR